MIGSLLYMLLFINPLQLFKIYYHSILDAFHQNGFELGHLRLLRTFIFHSFLKQILTDGANFLMTFANLISLQEQGKILKIAIKLNKQVFSHLRCN